MKPATHSAMGTTAVIVATVAALTDLNIFAVIYFVYPANHIVWHVAHRIKNR